jgi:chromosome partitioning protein
MYGHRIGRRGASLRFFVDRFRHHVADPLGKFKIAHPIGVFIRLFFVMPIWGVVNQKGGVGKTTTAVNLAAGLAIRGSRTLLVDCDPQGNATTGLGLDKQETETTLYEVLAAAVDGKGAEPELVRKAIHNVAPGLDLIPATMDLAGAEPLLMSAVGKEVILRDALEPILADYDWVVMDAPPSLGLLTINILAACDSILVPMQCEFYALEGLSQLLKTVDVVRRRINPSLKVAKVLLTMHDPRNRLTQQVKHEVKEYFGDKVSRVMIPRNVRLSESPSFGEAAVQLFPKSKGASAYLSFVDEVVETCGVR